MLLAMNIDGWLICQAKLDELYDERTEIAKTAVQLAAEAIVMAEGHGVVGLL